MSPAWSFPMGYPNITCKLRMEVTAGVDEGSLRLVREFVNTYDVESDAEALAGPDDLAKWLRHNGLLGSSAASTADRGAPAAKAGARGIR